MTWLLTGGAGYIGAHVLRAFGAAGLPVVVLDDLSTGDPQTVPEAVPLVRGSVTDPDAVRAVLADHEITAVLHLAAKKAVGESVAMPLTYWWENAEGTRCLLQACVEAGVETFLYSSSAAVYGMPDVDEVTEDSPTRPMSPYGETKLVGEWMLRDAARAHGLRWIALRYFNVAGAGAPELADRSVSNLIPLALRALTEGRPPQVFGSDYPTRDGTCIRDYIHVLDLAEAHVAAARALEGGATFGVYNVGRGEGSSVLEVLDAVREQTGRDFTPDLVGRRAGDPARLVASAGRIAAELGWSARLSLADMVASAWAAWQRH